MAMMWDIHIVLSLLIVIDSVDHFASGIGVIGAPALLQLLRLDLEIRIFIQLKQLLLHFLHHLGARAALIVLAHLNRQHLFWLKVIEQIGAWDQAQGAD